MRRLVLGVVGMCAASVPLQAQGFGNEWLELVRNDGSLAALPLDISDANHETDLAWGDLDQDGWIDLVVVRKEPFSTIGKRTNVLLMNEGGVLKDRTREFASASDVAGDSGFLTPTNDRDVVVVDVNNDGWLDVVTAITLSFDDPKYIGHPRVYVNLGETGGGWQGLRYEEARFPQLLHFGTGLPVNPVFCSVAAGDVDADGFADLYFSHYDFSFSGVFGGEIPFVLDPDLDLDDRLLLNDGNGYFSDESQASMTAQMLFSRFGLSGVIADINGDGYNDVLKNTALVGPYYVAACYNDPNNPGQFNIFDDFHDLQPYHIAVGDLNQDGRLDVAFGDDNQDRYRYNLGNDPLGRVIWGPAKTFDFLAGGDDGFVGDNLIVDLNDDGWAEVLMADVDTDEPGYNRRLHVYHNPGGAIGEEITLREEREQAAGGGWLGAVGLMEADLKGTHDVGVFDLENDGDKDLVISRKDGTFVWLNQTVPNHLFTDTAVISVSQGGVQNLTLDAGQEFAGDFYIMLGSTSGTSPGVTLAGFTLPLNVDAYFVHTLMSPNEPPLTSSLANLDGNGRGLVQFTVPVDGSPHLVGLTVHHAYGVFDPGPAIKFASEAVSVDLLP